MVTDSLFTTLYSYFENKKTKHTLNIFFQILCWYGGNIVDVNSFHEDNRGDNFSSIYSIHLWKFLEWSSLLCMTSAVTLMINDVDGFRWNFVLKSSYFLWSVQAKTNCPARLGVSMSALTEFKTDRWCHSYSCMRNCIQYVNFCVDPRRCDTPLLLSLELRTQHADWWVWPQSCRVARLFVFLIFSHSWLLSRLKLPPNMGSNDNDEKQYLLAMLLSL